MQALASTSCASTVVSARSSRIKLPVYTQLCAHSLAFNVCSQQSLWQGDQRLSVTRSGRINCALTKESPNAVEGPKNLDTEPHKYFDQVVITVRSGDGGNGAVLKLPKPKVDDGESRFKRKEKKPGTYKRANDGALILPLGGHGGDVILVADESADTLLPYHRKRRHNAKRGANVSSMGTLSPSLRDGLDASILRIPVPVGTVVKRKRGGKFLADLAKHGDEIMVARGGRGGICVVEAKDTKRLRDNGLPTIQDPDDKVVTLGGPGEEIALELTLRVVADVGLVGLPNAGKSSLLAAVTVAKPEIAAYPFTTLMPNLGCLEGDPMKNDGGFSSGATMADLPGLIKDAHLGKGLGRMFLRHLRRTRVLIHVVDASTPDPVDDYSILREELHLYNPEYVRRPHIVVLNKLDLPKGWATRAAKFHSEVPSLMAPHLIRFSSISTTPHLLLVAGALSPAPRRRDRASPAPRRWDCFVLLLLVAALGFWDFWEVVDLLILVEQTNISPTRMPWTRMRFQQLKDQACG